MEEADFVARRSPVRIGLLIALLAALSLVLLLVDFAEIARNISNRRLAVIDALAVMARVIGGVGLLIENHVARLMMDAEVIYTYEGTNEINMLLVGRTLTGINAIT